MQQSPSQSNNLNSHTSQDQNHLKIKPLLQIHSKRNYSDEINLQKSLKLYSKASRQAKFLTIRNNPANRHSKTFTKILRAQTKPSNLQYNLEFPTSNIENRLLFSQLKSLSSASSLKMTLFNFLQANIQSIKGLWENLPHLKNITTLDMKLQFLNLQNPEILLQILNSTRKIRTITSLSFTISKCTNLSQIHLDILSHYLKKLSQLQTLKLSFDPSINPAATNIFRNLASLLPKLPFLTQLELSFDNLKNIPISHVSELFQSLHHLKNLTDLTLSFKRCEILSEPDQPLFTIFPYLALPSLHKLRLDLPRLLDDRCLETLSKVLQNLTLLNTISLDLIFCLNITEKGIESLRLALSSLEKLSSLALNLPLLLETQSIFGKVASTVKSLPSLRKLKLKFKKKMVEPPLNNPSIHDIQDLFTNLRLLKSLQFLEIVLPNDHELQDDSFEILAESLKELASLKDFYFNSGYPRLLTNKGVKAISHTIKGLTNLSELILFIKFNKNVNEEALNFLGEALLDHPALSSIKLTFLACPDVTNLQGFGILFQALKQMKEPCDVLLHIPGSKNDGLEADYLNERKMLKTSWQ